MTLLVTFITSLLLGMRHATDPDHVIAVTTIVTSERSLARAARIGALWGLGHTLTILLVGGAIIVFKVAFSVRLGLSMEFTVALMLIVLGVLNLVNASAPITGTSTARPVFIGIVHGLAGSAAAALLLVPLIDDPRFAALYLLVFGLGTIVGMSMVTLAIAAPALAAGAPTARVQWSLRIASGAVSVVFGVYLAHKVGVSEGLFRLR
ncbi:MAG: high-affinity nickel-transport family protein [Gemmatimonadota bacterium]|nr:high-affinity nickel-transport family protein [Gemmatimonadota bacterium]